MFRLLTQVFSFAPRARQAATPARRRPAVECLEERLALSGSTLDIVHAAPGPNQQWTYSTKNPSNPGIVFITGADSHDYVRVSQSDDGKFVNIEYAPLYYTPADPKGTFNRSEVKTVSFRATLVTDIYFEGRGGDDYFKNDTFLPTYAWGDQGRSNADANQVMVGGNDVLIGGYGLNHLWGGGGDDLLVSNTVRGAAFALTMDLSRESVAFYARMGPLQFHSELYGDGGDDTLIGSDLQNYLEGGWGSDKLYGGAAPDALFGDAAYDSRGNGPGRQGDGIDLLQVGRRANDYRGLPDVAYSGDKADTIWIYRDTLTQVGGAVDEVFYYDNNQGVAPSGLAPNAEYAVFAPAPAASMTSFAVLPLSSVALNVSAVAAPTNPYAESWSAALAAGLFRDEVHLGQELDLYLAQRLAAFPQRALSTSLPTLNVPFTAPVPGSPGSAVSLNPVKGAPPIDYSMGLATDLSAAPVHDPSWLV